MTKKKTSKKEPVKKEPEEFDYVGFTIKFSKLCMKLMVFMFTQLKHIYYKVQIYRMLRKIKKENHHCAQCKEYFEEV